MMKRAFATGRYVNGRRVMILADGTEMSIKDYYTAKRLDVSPEEYLKQEKEKEEKKAMPPVEWAVVPLEEAREAGYRKVEKVSWFNKLFKRGNQ